MAKDKKKKKPDWEVEASFDAAATLEELIDEPPFKEVSDQHGHSATAGTRIPFWLQRRFQKIIEMPGSPYEIMSDVLRDALYRGGRILQLKYSMSADWDIEAKLAATVGATTAARRIRRQIEELVQGLDEMNKDGDTDRAVEYLTDYVVAACDLDSDWHREKVFKLLNEDKVIRDITKHCSTEVQKLLEQGGK